MKRYALDSNIISYLLKKDRLVAERIRKAISFGNEVAILPIAYYEIKRGLIAVNASSKMRLFMKFCVQNKVGDINLSVLDAAADIHASLRRIGRVTEDADILIAAFCVTHGYTLVTHNTRHFEDIDGLHVEDWVEN